MGWTLTLTSKISWSAYLHIRITWSTNCYRITGNPGLKKHDRQWRSFTLSSHTCCLVAYLKLAQWVRWNISNNMMSWIGCWWDWLELWKFHAHWFGQLKTPYTLLALILKSIASATARKVSSVNTLYAGPPKSINIWKLLVLKNLIFIALQNRFADSKLIHSESTFLRCGLFFLYERFHKPSDVEY